MGKRIEWCRAAAVAVVVLGACGGGGGAGGRGDAGAGGCAADEECPAEAPVCDRSTGACVGCDPILHACERFDGMPYCIDGGCVGCGLAGESEWCTGRNSRLPVCEAETGACRECAANAECGSGACADGECVPQEESIYVAPGGSPASECTRQDPCGTIARGFEVADPSRRIVVLADGTYDEPVVVSDTVGSYVASVVGDGAILQRSTAGPVIRVRDHIIRFERIVVHGGSGSNGHGLYCTGTSSSVDTSVGLKQVVIRRNSQNGVLSDGCHVELLGSVVEDNTGVGVVLVGTHVVGAIDTCWVRRNGGGGVDMDDDTYAIWNSVIADNGNLVDAQVGGLLIHHAGLNGAGEVRHVTVARNSIASASDRNAGIHCLERPAILANSIAWENEGSAPQVGAECSARYTLVSPGPFPGGDGNVDGEPAFVDPDAGNYDLGAASEAIDRGDPAARLPLDIHGDPRGLRDLADLGADEYVP